MCTLTVDSHESADGSLRYMLGGEPILSPAGERLVDAKGRPSYVTSAGSGPSVGRHLLMAYLPADRTRSRATRCWWSTWASSTRSRWRGPARPRCSTRRTRGSGASRHGDSRLHQAGPHRGRQDRGDPGRAGGRHPGVRVLDQPARGMRGRGGGADHRAGRRLGLRADPRSRGGDRAAARRARARRAPGGAAGDGRPGVRPDRDGRRHRRRGPGAPVRPGAAGQRGGRHRRLPGRRPARARARLAGRHRDQEPVGVFGRRRGRPPGVPRRGGGVLPAAAGRVTVKEGINLPRYPSLPGRLRAKRAAVDRSSPEWAAEGLRKSALRVPESSKHQAEVLGEGVDAVPTLVRVLEEWGCSHDRAGPGRTRRRPSPPTPRCGR